MNGVIAGKRGAGAGRYRVGAERWVQPPPRRRPAGQRPGSGRPGGYFFSSMVTSTSGQRRATGWMDGRAMILVNSLLSVAMDSR